MAVDSTCNCESVAAIGDLDGFVPLAENSSVLEYYWVAADGLPEVAVGFSGGEVSIRLNLPKYSSVEVMPC